MNMELGRDPMVVKELLLASFSGSERCEGGCTTEMRVFRLPDDMVDELQYDSVLNIVRERVFVKSDDDR